MAFLFQDEADEEPGLFQTEPDECVDTFLFQDELPETEKVVPPPASTRGHSASEKVVQPQEPDEPPAGSRRLFGIEPDETDSGDGASESEKSAYLGDCEENGGKDRIARVQLNFSTLSKFLASNLKSATTEASAVQPKKKRRYNNEGRARAAAERKAEAEPAGLKKQKGMTLTLGAVA